MAFENAFQMPLSGYLLQEDQAEGSAIFNKAKTSISQATETAIIDTCDFRPFRRIIDVGGGHGAMLSAMTGTTRDRAKYSTTSDRKYHQMERFYYLTELFRRETAINSEN